MNKTEEAIVRATMENLKKARVTEWTSGGLDQWSTWAKKMRDTIIASDSTITALLDASGDEDSKNGDSDLAYIFNLLIKLEDMGALNDDAEVIFRQIIEEQFGGVDYYTYIRINYGRFSRKKGK